MYMYVNVSALQYVRPSIIFSWFVPGEIVVASSLCVFVRRGSFSSLLLLLYIHHKTLLFEQHPPTQHSNTIIIIIQSSTCCGRAPRPPYCLITAQKQCGRVSSEITAQEPNILFAIPEFNSFHRRVLTSAPSYTHIITTTQSPPHPAGPSPPPSASTREK